MSHREIMRALSGLLLGLFVAMLSSTIVTNALPKILADLHGGESAYTWIVASTLLAVTASTPLWGKLADLFSKKLLVQISLISYVTGSMLAGLAQNPAQLIACRVLQGLAVGGISALAQVCMAAMISPRERGRYSGYFGMAFALATVGGPLIGGVIVDTSWLGWRWCFYVCVPLAVVAVIILQRTLHLPTERREGVRIDYLGATLIAASVTLLLVWVTLAGNSYAWLSWQTAAMVGGSLLLGLAAVRTEARAAEPIVPLRMFRHRTVVLATVASVMVGVGMYGATMFLSQYFQLARGKSPIASGFATTPMVLGLAVASYASGKLITRTGRWKSVLLAGAAFLAAGFALLGVLRADTPYWVVAVAMAVAGVGVGTVMQNLVLAVQNTVPAGELGIASSMATFFRTLGGAIGVSALGAVLAAKVSHDLGGHGAGGAIPDVSTLPATVRPLVEAAFGRGIGTVFLWCVPFALIAALSIWLIREVPLKTESGIERMASSEDAGATVDTTPDAEQLSA